jgi:hypothetical protein
LSWDDGNAVIFLEKRQRRCAPTYEPQPKSDFDAFFASPKEDDLMLHFPRRDIRARLRVGGHDLFRHNPRMNLTSVTLAFDQGTLVLGGALPVYPDGVTLGRWRVIHGDLQTSVGAIVQGHEHPWARWSRQIGGPCYLVHAERLILPAFSRDAAGVNVLADPRWAAFRCCVVAGERVLDFGCLGRLRFSGRDR